MNKPELIKVTVVPALPGYAVVFYDEESPYALDPTMKDDIVAWQTATYSYVQPNGNIHLTTHIDPITFEGSQSGDHYAILRPDGCIEDPYTATYGSYRDYTEAKIQERKEREERKKSKEQTNGDDA